MASAHVLHQPTALCLSISGFKSLGSGLNAKEHLKKGRPSCKAAPRFSGFGVWLSAEHCKGARVHA